MFIIQKLTDFISLTSPQITSLWDLFKESSLDVVSQTLCNFKGNKSESWVSRLLWDVYKQATG